MAQHGKDSLFLTVQVHIGPMLTLCKLPFNKTFILGLLFEKNVKLQFALHSGNSYVKKPFFSKY